MGPLVRLMQVALRVGVSQQKSFLFGCPSADRLLALARLQNRLLLNQLAHPVDEETHLRRKMSAFRVHHQDGVLFRRPVHEQLCELP